MKTIRLLLILTTIITFQISAQSAAKSDNPKKSYELEQNYPNPFNPETNINFTIPKAGFVSLKVYNMLGQEVESLVNEFKEAGNYSVSFNGEDLLSGLYFYKLVTDDFSQVKKMTLLK